MICFYSNIGVSESKVIFKWRNNNNNNNNLPENRATKANVDVVDI